MHKDGENTISPDNRSFKFGDGLFETMRVVDGSIAMAEYHFERLFEGISKLQFDCPEYFTPIHLADEILTLCKKNKLEKAARVRLNVFRGNGGLYDPENLSPNYIIQNWPLQQMGFAWNKQGLTVGVYEMAKKSCDEFSALKSNNFLPYIMAGLHAKQNSWNDCIVLNQYGRICDATIANIFIVKNHSIFTPPLSEGPVAGTMRRFILEELPSEVFDIKETTLSIDDLNVADEMILTNAVQGARWVRNFQNKEYQNTIGSQLAKAINKKVR